MTPNPKPEELQSCPFCGNLPELDMGYVRCRKPSCAMFGSLFGVEEWNTRRPLVSKTTKQEDSPQFVAYRSPDGDLLGECGEGEAPASPATEAALSFEAWFNSQDLPFVVMGGKKNAEYMTHCAWHARDSEIAALREENERLKACGDALEERIGCGCGCDASGTCNACSEAIAKWEVLRSTNNQNPTP